MRVEADLGRSTLSVALDLRHPFAYLALGPAIHLGRELGLAVNWLPLRGQPLRPPSEPRDDDDRSVLHRRHRARMIAREIAIYSEARGLTLAQPYRDAPAGAASRAWLWTRARSPDLLEPFLGELFRRYWALELDPAAPGAVAEVVGATGGDAPGFLAWADAEGAEADDRVAAQLAEAGIYQSPAYLVEDQVFYGRQHLPMIRWLLEGQKGPVPI